MDIRDQYATFGSPNWPEGTKFCDATMKATFTLDRGEGDDEHTVDFIYDVCSLCDGKGTHVNPSIDAHGISREEFDEDPDFEQDYLSGTFDQPCNCCRGRRVEPVLRAGAEGDDVKALLEWREAEADFRWVSAAERAMGA